MRLIEIKADDATGVTPGGKGVGRIFGKADRWLRRVIEDRRGRERAGEQGLSAEFVVW